jgi:hypothetical protein
MYQLMTAESLQAAQQLDEQISALAQRHAASQLAKNTLTGVSAKPAALLQQVSAARVGIARCSCGLLYQT